MANSTVATPPSLLLLAATMCLGACHVGLESIGDELGDSGTDTTDASTSDSSTTQTDDAETSGTQGMSDELVAAHGIEILEVEANQAVAIPLTAKGGAWIDPSDRNAPLVGERRALIRVHWQVGAGWQPQEVTARLRLWSMGAELEPREQTLLVDGDSNPASIDQTFNFGIDASEASADMEFLVELLSAPEDLQGELSELTSAAPASGPATVGFGDDPMTLEIMFVPIRYTFGGDFLPDMSEETLAPIVDRLHDMLPVQEVVWTLHEPLEYDAQLNSPGDLLGPISNLRGTDQAAANVYYYAVVNPGCVGEPCSLNGQGGVGLLAGPTEADANSRVSVSVADDISGLAGSVVHELGHNHGLAHVDCPAAMAGGSDPSYPYADGSTGVWGYGLRSGQLYNPASYSSFMSYCQPTWVSDWGYAKLHERVRILTSWTP